MSDSLTGLDPRICRMRAFGPDNSLDFVGVNHRLVVFC